MTRAVVEVQGLRKRFGAKQAIEKIDLSVREGEVLGVLGPSGAGKTTTLRCIAGLHKPDAGTIRLDGVDVTHVSPMERDIAVVFEGFNLLPTLSVFDNIAFPLRSPLYRAPEDEVKTRVMRAAGDLRIAGLLDRHTDEISGGERQRVALARALVRRPKLFLLDEPLASLDLKLREALENELRDMHRERGQTFIYASHDFLGTAAIASRIAVIDKGRLLQTGTLAEIYADPSHRRVRRTDRQPGHGVARGEGARRRAGDRRISRSGGRFRRSVWDEGRWSQGDCRSLARGHRHRNGGGAGLRSRHGLGDGLPRPRSGDRGPFWREPDTQSDSDRDDARARRELFHSTRSGERRSCSICRAAAVSAPTRYRTMGSRDKMIAKLYAVATALIILGVVMLCQPFLLLIHVWAFPVFLVGFVLFMILDHLPSFEDRTKTTE